MLSKGLKRKLEDEDEPEVSNNGSSLDESESESSSGYRLQRQTVLNLSLLKLHSVPGHSEPRLSRRVLISNTLRHIRDELRVEGGASVRLQPSITKDAFSSALADIEDLCPTVGITALFSTADVSSSSESVHSDESRSVDSDLSEMRSKSLSDSTHSVLGHTSSLIADFSLDDFLFTEIDNFLLDSKTGFGGAGIGQSALQTNQTFKLDLSELDHIMEVLVGS